MPVTSLSLDSTDSAHDSLRVDALLTPPPVSHKIFDDIPFRPQDDDHVSLSMKKSSGHRHKRPDTFSQRTASTVRTQERKRKTHSGGTRSRSRSRRKTNPLTSVQPRFDHGTIETLETSEALPQRARRLTIPSKASSTCGIATLVPVDDTAQRTGSGTPTILDAEQSPAMITLRRATTTRSRGPTTTLTSFPTPKFSRGSNGLLSSFLNSVTGQNETPVYVNTEFEPTRYSVQKSRRTSTVSTKHNVRPSTGTVAPPVQTEVVAVEPRLSASGSNQAVGSMRRCSTRYISENAVYEIIWDENWNSSPSSAGGNPSPHGQGSILASRELAGVETLERRLSNALTRSRRASVQDSRRRRTSWVTGYDLSVQSIWTNPKIARLFREPASDRLPRSRSSKGTDKMPALPADKNRLMQAVGPELLDHVEFFPPLRSRANTNGSIDVDKSSPTVADFGPSPTRNRFGSMVGISTHTKKRNSTSTVTHYKEGWRKSMNVGGRRASEGQKRAMASDDERVPLLDST